MRVSAFALALVAVLSPLAAEAQPAGKLWRIGTLSGLPPDAPRWAPFRQRLSELGYVEGRNIILEGRVSGGRAERFTDLAGELARLNVDVIVATDNPAIAAAQRATKTIPIVMVVAQDPVASVFAESLARPGGNITGVSTMGTDLQGKMLQVLKEAVPVATRVGILWVPTEPGREVQAKEAEVAARALRMQPLSVEVRDPAALDVIFEGMARDKLHAVHVHPSQMTFAHRERIAALAAKHRLPSIGSSAWYAEAGGLLAYGAKDSDLYDRAAYYVAKILDGAKPRNLPIWQPTKFELKINLKTAKALGLTIPTPLLQRADLFIQ